ncbi:bacterial transcriptional activator domain-containing protein [Streptomyces sp. NPDC059431]|uniref:bacterial transcriptional activator domain-containing protein n=1 Tax=unclassified Streptomyces TaxID=2593676 RepID=UPI0036B2E2F3
MIIEVYIVEGNVASALKRYQQYQSFLRRELGVFPSTRMTELVQDLVGGSQVEDVPGLRRSELHDSTATVLKGPHLAP